MVISYRLHFLIFISAGWPFRPVYVWFCCLNQFKTIVLNDIHYLIFHNIVSNFPFIGKTFQDLENTYMYLYFCMEGTIFCSGNIVEVFSAKWVFNLICKCAANLLWPPFFFLAMKFFSGWVFSFQKSMVMPLFCDCLKSSLAPLLLGFLKIVWVTTLR